MAKIYLCSMQIWRMHARPCRAWPLAAPNRPSWVGARQRLFLRGLSGAWPTAAHPPVVHPPVVPSLDQEPAAGRSEGGLSLGTGPLVGRHGAQNFFAGAGQGDSELAFGLGKLEGTDPHADLLVADAQHTADAQYYALDLVARAHD